MSLLWIDLKAIGLALLYQGIHQFPSVGKVHILIDHSMNYQKPVLPIEPHQKTNKQNHAIRIQSLKHSAYSSGNFLARLSTDPLAYASLFTSGRPM